MFLQQRDFQKRSAKYPCKGELPVPAWGDPSFVVHRVVPSCQQVVAGGNPWPETTDLACLWCEEGFDWAPVGAPVYHDAKKDQFTLKWNFCSFNCCKAWMHKNRPREVSNVYWLAMRLFGKDSAHRQRLEGIQPAPQKEALRKYGGWMSIEEFRSNAQLIRPAGAHGINIRWDPVHLSVQTNAAQEMAVQSRGAMPSCPAPSKPQPVLASKPAAPAPLARPNTLDMFIRSGQAKQKHVSVKPAPPSKRARKHADRAG